MTKRQFIELIQLRLSENSIVADKLRKYPYQVIEKTVEAAYNTNLVNLYVRSNTYKSDLDLYTKTYPSVPVTSDEAEIPVTKLPQLPNNEALRYVADANNINNPVFYIQNYSTPVFNRLDVSSEMADDVMYYVEDNKIHLINNGVTALSDLYIKAVAPFSDFTDEEELPMPLGSEITVYDIVLQRMMQMRNPDQITDNNPSP